MKKTLLILSIFCIFYYPTSKIVKTFWYYYHLDNKLYKILENKIKNQNSISDSNILITQEISQEGNSSNVINWNGIFVRHADIFKITKIQGGGRHIESDIVIQIKKNENNTWTTIFRPDCSSSYALIHSDTLLYFCGHVPIINQQGEVVRNLLPWWLTIDGPAEVIQIDRKLYFIENDTRLQWITPRSLLSGVLAGPNIVTATEIDMDTLEYAEHVIAYDKYWVGEIE